MAKPLYLVCSERSQKPVTRAICDSRPEADKALTELVAAEEVDPEDRYWVAEVIAGSDAWRWLAAAKS